MSIKINDNIISKHEVGDYSYIITVDGECYGWCKKPATAQKIVADLAKELANEIEEPNTKVSIVNDGTYCVKVYRQRMGYIYDGIQKLKHTVEFKKIPKYETIKQVNIIREL